MHSEFMAFVTDEASRTTLQNWAERQGFPTDSVQSGGADLFSTLLESEAPPKLVFVDLEDQDQPIQIAARLVSLCGPASKLIALGSANDVTLYRSMIAAGLTDYIVKPFAPEALTQAMLLASRAGTATAATRKEAKTIVVTGARGGIGTSTIALNLAWIVAHEMKHKCVLLDLDLQFGVSALALDLEPGHGLRDIVSSPQRVDGLMISSAIVAESGNLDVLSAEESLDEPIHVDNAAIAALLKELRINHRTLVVDLPRHLAISQKRLLTVANEIVLTTELSLVGIRDTLRLLTAIKSLGGMGRVTLVATRVGLQHPGGVDSATFMKGVKEKLDFTIPEDPKSVMAASNAGKTLPSVAPNAPLTKALRTLCHHVAETPAATEAVDEKKSLWSALLGTGKKSGS
jgi:pilus assembly protein CpaE